MKKIYHWVSEEKNHVRFGTWDAKEVSLVEKQCLTLCTFKGEVSWEFGVMSKNPRNKRNLKVLLICCKLTPQHTNTIDECLWPQMNLVRMDCYLKKVRLTVFKLSRFHFQNALEQVMKLFLSRNLFS